MRPTHVLAGVALAAIAAAVAACGSTAAMSDAPGVTLAAPTAGSSPRSTSTDTPASSAGPSTVATTTPPHIHIDDRGVAVEIRSTERIIPLDGDVAEVVFALGMGHRVVATDLSATYPPEADALPQIGYQRVLNAEPILAFEPTLLIGTDLAGPPEVIDDLERVGVPVVIVPAPDDSSGPGVKIRAIAEVLGIADEGERLASEVEAGIAAVAPIDPTTSPIGALRVAVLYLRGESTQLVFGSATSIGWLIEATGSVNVAGDLGIVETADLAAEALVAAAPDVLLVTEDGLESVGGLDGLLAMPSIAGTPAAAHRAVLAYDAQLMLGNGPRTADFLAQLVTDLSAIRDRLAVERVTDHQETP